MKRWTGLEGSVRRLGLEIRGGGVGPMDLVERKGVAQLVGIWLMSDVIYWDG